MFSFIITSTVYLHSLRFAGLFLRRAMPRSLLFNRLVSSLREIGFIMFDRIWFYDVREILGFYDVRQNLVLWNVNASHATILFSSIIHPPSIFTLYASPVYSYGRPMPGSLLFNRLVSSLREIGFIMSTEVEGDGIINLGFMMFDRFWFYVVRQILGLWNGNASHAIIRFSSIIHPHSLRFAGLFLRR